MQTTLNPPVDYGTDIPLPDLTMLLISVAGVIIFLLLFYYRMEKAKKTTLADVRPSVQKMIADEMPIARYALVQAVMMLVPMFVIMTGITYMQSDPLLAGMTIIAAVGMTVAIQQLMQNKSREENKGKINMEGVLRTIDGTKYQYTFRNVEFMTERFLTTEEITKIAKDTKFSEKDLEEVRVYPIIIDNDYTSLLINSHSLAEAFEYVKGFDLDIWGDFDVDIATPELREISSVHRVRDDPVDDDYSLDEVVPVFLVVWDDVRSRAVVEDIAPVDVTRDTVLAGLLKSIAVEERTTAGKLNSTTAQLLDKQYDEREFDAIVSNRANGIAAGIEDDRDALALLDRIGDGFNWQQLLMLVISFLFGAILGANIIMANMVIP